MTNYVGILGVLSPPPPKKKEEVASLQDPLPPPRILFTVD